MYGHRDRGFVSASGGRHDRHQHHRGKSTHSTRDRGKKQRRESISRKEKDTHRGGRGRSRSGEGGVGDNDGGVGGRGVQRSGVGVQGFKDIGGNGGGSSGNGGGSSGNGGGSSVNGSESSVNGGAGGFVLCERVSPFSPPAVSYGGGSGGGGGGVRGGGFEICMPISSSNISTTNSRKREDHWGSIIELRTTPPSDEIPKVQLWQRDWRPGPLTCTIPRTYDPPATTSPQPEEKER